MVKYYELTMVNHPEPEPGDFIFLTAACITCSLCGKIIDGMGGPGTGPICIECGEVVIGGRARGAIKWEEK